MSYELREKASGCRLLVTGKLSMNVTLYLKY
jgi:hypothetical protein